MRKILLRATCLREHHGHGKESPSDGLFPCELRVRDDRGGFAREEAHTGHGKTGTLDIDGETDRRRGGQDGQDRGRGKVRKDILLGRTHHDAGTKGRDRSHVQEKYGKKINPVQNRPPRTYQEERDGSQKGHGRDYRDDKRNEAQIQEFGLHRDFPVQPQYRGEAQSQRA